ncbi:hypothetical protein [Spongiactinospora sp. TRM90649]|uniref:hypothetical protein n=1 Tax=Spongiactinospora sp. TRM90649 TaxID=3031114 RepID=UPI0023F7098D|nr:hypothetical protein [Spongiactinospora sp. TRM90649]MDF5751586.1 hypothetical protein [Spongiactinospora sp. TRM90649]
MLKSKARRRVALKTAALGAIGCGLVFGAIPALAAPVDVQYTCTPTNGQPGLTVVFPMELVGPSGTPQPNTAVTVNWRIGGSASPTTSSTATGSPTASPSATPTTSDTNSGTPTTTSTPLPAPVTIASGAMIAAEGTLSISGPVASSTPVAKGTVVATQSLSTTDDLPIPTSMAVVLQPTGEGTIVLQGQGFVLKSGSGTSTVYYNCIAAGAGPALNLPVGGTGSPTASATPTATPTASDSTSPTPRRTNTKTATVTADSQIDKTPKDGAATGGGGDMGPDGRMFVLVGSVLVVGAGIGGLLLRRRTAATRG